MTAALLLVPFSPTLTTCCLNNERKSTFQKVMFSKPLVTNSLESKGLNFTSKMGSYPWLRKHLMSSVFQLVTWIEKNLSMPTDTNNSPSRLNSIFIIPLWWKVFIIFSCSQFFWFHTWIWGDWLASPLATITFSGWIVKQVTFFLWPS